MQDLAKQLKAQLEQAQKAKDAAPRSQGPKDTATKVKDTEEENVVVLTCTGRDGMVRPLPEQEFDGEGGGRRRRRKKKNVSQRCLPGAPWVMSIFYLVFKFSREVCLRTACSDHQLLPSIRMRVSLPLLSSQFDCSNRRQSNVTCLLHYSTGGGGGIYFFCKSVLFCFPSHASMIKEDYLSSVQTKCASPCYSFHG